MQPVTLSNLYRRENTLNNFTFFQAYPLEIQGKSYDVFASSSLLCLYCQSAAMNVIKAEKLLIISNN